MNTMLEKIGPATTSKPQKIIVSSQRRSTFDRMVSNLFWQRVLLSKRALACIGGDIEYKSLKWIV